MATPSKDTNQGTASKEAFASADTQAADNAGISEGEIKALRDDAGVNQSAGHQSDIHAWSQSEQGKEWIKGAKDRDKEAEAEAKRYDEATNKDGLTEAEAKYQEAVKGNKK